MVKDKNNNNNSSNSLVVGRWPQTKRWAGLTEQASLASYGPLKVKAPEKV